MWSSPGLASGPLAEEEDSASPRPEAQAQVVVVGGAQLLASGGVVTQGLRGWEWPQRGDPPDLHSFHGFPHPHSAGGGKAASWGLYTGSSSCPSQPHQTYFQSRVTIPKGLVPAKGRRWLSEVASAMDWILGVQDQAEGTSDRTRGVCGCGHASPTYTEAAHPQ